MRLSGTVFSEVLGMDTDITEELPRSCQNVFRISAAREDTMILGGSMGGYGALKCALSKPEQYGFCGAFSSGCLFLKEGLEETREHGMRPEFVASFGEQLIKDFRAAFGEGLHWKPELDILELAKGAAKQGPRPRLYLTCGTKDPFYSDHIRFCKELDEMGLPYTFEEWEAAHDFLYFNEAMRRAVQHFSQGGDGDGEKQGRHTG